MKLFVDHLQWGDYRLMLASRKKGLSYVGLESRATEQFFLWQKKYLPTYQIIPSKNILAPYRKTLEAYFTGRNKSFDIELDLIGSPFQLKVWRSLLQVPFGDLWSYSEIAEAMDRPSSVRAIANAIGKNPILIVIPCHRIIRKDQSLAGYRDGVELKQALINFEAMMEGK